MYVDKFSWHVMPAQVSRYFHSMSTIVDRALAGAFIALNPDMVSPTSIKELIPQMRET